MKDGQFISIGDAIIAISSHRALRKGAIAMTPLDVTGAPRVIRTPGLWIRS
jgi:hypothetical protein